MPDPQPDPTVAYLRAQIQASFTQALQYLRYAEQTLIRATARSPIETELNALRDGTEAMARINEAVECLKNAYAKYDELQNHTFREQNL
jgi:hypothetical protein